MTAQGHAVRVRTPMKGASLPIRWVVTTWCGKRLERVLGAPGATTGAITCSECREALRGAQAA